MPKQQYYYEAAIVEGAGDFDRLEIFNVLRLRAVFGPLAFCLYQNETGVVRIEPTFFGTAAKQCTSAAALLGSIFTFVFLVQHPF